MDSKLKREEENWDSCLRTFSNFDLLKFTEVRLWNRSSLFFEICFWVVFFALRSRSWSLSLCIFLLGVLLILVVLNLNVKHNVLRECVFDLEVDLESFVQLCWLLDDFNWVSLIDIWNQLEDHSCGLDVAFFLICEDYLALDLGWNTGLEPYWESNALTGLNLHLFLLDWKVAWTNQFHPVTNWVLWWIGKLDIFSDQVT